MESNHITIGKNGEDFAVKYLIENNYKILQRNYRKKWGEIDIITFDLKTKEIVFIEVKTIQIRKNKKEVFLPEEELTLQKIQKLKKVILSFLAEHHLDNNKWRFDLIAIEAVCSPAFQITSAKLRHYQSIFLEF
jgi:putative endonuclease